MIVVNTESIPGYQVTHCLGIVQGNVVRAKHIGRDIAASLKNIVGGELRGYTELLTESRQTAMERVAALGMGTATIIHPNVECSRWVEIGPGAVICAGTILTTNIRLGLQVQINLDCTVGHDVIMGDYTTLAPGAHISGWVHLGRRVYVGTGAVIINGTQESPLIVGDDAVIGAGACVTKAVPPDVTVVGVPAKPLQRA